MILAPIIWFFLPVVFSSEDNFQGPAVDSGARIELEMLRQQLEDVQERLSSLQGQVASLESRGFAVQPGFGASAEEIARLGPNAIIDAYAQVVLIANRRNVNKGLTVSSPDYLESKLGRPREVLSDKCENMSNQRLADLLVLEEVGPIRVHMLQPAVDSLRRVFENVRAVDPDLYDRINTAGSLCVRRIRGTQDQTSTHSYGLAVDLNIDGHLDTLGDNRTQLGLTILADFFRNEGWVWGAGFGREDSMHFEISQKQLNQWLATGAL
ncbi:MAG: M15 family metallopeptidase [Paracoccaceae bacterium]